MHWGVISPLYLLSAMEHCKIVSDSLPIDLYSCSGIDTEVVKTGISPLKPRVSLASYPGSKIVRRRKIEPGTHCLRMCKKFHVKLPPITLYDGV